MVQRRARRAPCRRGRAASGWLGLLREQRLPRLMGTDCVCRMFHPVGSSRSWLLKQCIMPPEPHGDACRGRAGRLCRRRRSASCGSASRPRGPGERAVGGEGAEGLSSRCVSHRLANIGCHLGCPSRPSLARGEHRFSIVPGALAAAGDGRGRDRPRKRAACRARQVLRLPGGPRHLLPRPPLAGLEAAGEDVEEHGHHGGELALRWRRRRDLGQDCCGQSRASKGAGVGVGRAGVVVIGRSRALGISSVASCSAA